MGGFGQKMPTLAGSTPDLFQPPVPENRRAEFYQSLEEARARFAKQDLPIPDWFVNNLVSQYFGDSLEQAYGGGEKLFGSGKTLDERLGGASDIVRGGMKMAAPFVLPEALLAAPAATLTGLGVGALTGYGGEEASKKLGLGPGASALVGDVTGLAGGGVAARPENLMEVGRQFDRINFGSERGSFSRKPVLRDASHLFDHPINLKGKELTADLGAALDDFMKKGKLPRFGKGSDPDPYRERALEMMTRDVKYGLKNYKDAREWYEGMVQEMEDEMIKNRPGFSDKWKGKDPTGNPTNGNIRRQLFKYMLAVTSNGIDPQANFDAAMHGWDLYLRKGEMLAYDPDIPSDFDPTKPKGLTHRANSYESAMGRINRLVQEKGEAGAVEWLQTEHPFAELKKYDPKIEGAQTHDQRLGSYILGEKVGAFGGNLNGIHTELTADKWWSRTWNRWMGTVMATKASGEPVLDKEGLPALQDDPRNFAERTLMRETATKVAGDLGIKVDELQAVLWYMEQSLYRAHGIPADSIGYGEAARTHFGKRQAVQPGGTAGNRAPPTGRGANAQPAATQRGSPATPASLSGRSQKAPRKGQ